MATEETLRRGEPETRSNFDRAKGDFEDATGTVTASERPDACPTCGATMTIRKEYKEPEHYHMTGICSASADHNIERFGYYSKEGTE